MCPQLVTGSSVLTQHHINSLNIHTFNTHYCLPEKVNAHLSFSINDPIKQSTKFTFNELIPTLSLFVNTRLLYLHFVYKSVKSK